MVASANANIAQKEKRRCLRGGLKGLRRPKGAGQMGRKKGRKREGSF